MRAEDGSVVSASTGRPSSARVRASQAASAGTSRSTTSCSRRARVGEDEAGQHRPDDDTDDEQPPVELGVHRLDRRGSDRSDGNDRLGGSFRIEAKHARVRIAVERASGRDAATLPAMPTPDLTQAATSLVTPIAAITSPRTRSRSTSARSPSTGTGSATPRSGPVYRVLDLARPETRLRGPDILDNGIVIVGDGGADRRAAYHVIDQWQLYKNDPIKVFLPARIRGWASTAGSSPARSPRTCTRATEGAVPALGGHRGARACS